MAFITTGVLYMMLGRYDNIVQNIEKMLQENRMMYVYF